MKTKTLCNLLPLLLMLVTLWVINTLAEETEEDEFLTSMARNTHLHGYHETHANITLNGEKILDPHRTVLGLESYLSSDFIFSLELDFEHAFQDPELEFAELQYRLNPRATLVAGTMLMPFGRVNEYHEPPFYSNVERPIFHQEFVPTSWQDIGLGLRWYSKGGSLNFRTALVNGMSAYDVSDGKPLLKPNLRLMKQKARDAHFKDLAWVGRLGWSPISMATVGMSFYGGGADQRDEDSLQIYLGMAALDSKISWKGLCLILESGWAVKKGEVYEQKGDDLLQSLALAGEIEWISSPFKHSEGRVTAFFRADYIDSEINWNSPSAQLVYTTGLNLHPIPKVVFKAEFQHFTHENPRAYMVADRQTSQMQQVNIGLGLYYP